MPTTLGLDLGTNSIGWALVEDGKRIIKSGVRIFPVGVQEEDFLKNGKEVSKNISRRLARGARRRRFRFKLRRQKLVGVLQKNAMMPDDEHFFSTRELYQLRVKGLDHRLTLQEFGRVLLMLNKRRGFKSNRKVAANPDEKKEEGIVKEQITKLQAEIDRLQHRTVGEYFLSLFLATDANAEWPSKDTPIERIRDRFVGREMYEREFEQLWESQRRFYPDLLTDDLKAEIGPETIYYQRNLRSQKGLVGKCRFEPGKRCAQRSSLEFQEYRIWQQLWVVRFASGDRVGQELTTQEKNLACAELMKNYKLTEAKLKAVLGLPKGLHFNDVFDLKGNRTSADLIRALGRETFERLSHAQKLELWHILTYADNVEKLKEIVRKKVASGILPSLSEDQIDSYSQVNLEDGFCNLSKKALDKILPYLREGYGLTESIEKAGYNPTVKPLKHGAQELTSVPPLAPNELRNPIVQQMLSETFRVVNAIIREFGKPDRVRIELARELKKPKNRREEARGNALRKRAQREEFASFLSTKFGQQIEPGSPEVRKYELWLEMGCEDQSLDDLRSFMRNGRVTDALKYRLWKECNRISPYSGKVIPLGRLFSPEIQVEHILPYSQTMNNEFGNLCLCEAEINKKKGDRLPYEYFESIGKLDEFRTNVSRLQNDAKRRRFLAKEIPEGFLNSQLNNTSYAATELAWRLSSVFPPVDKGDNKSSPRVQVVNGQATSDLRRLWGNLNRILTDGEVDTKNRGDHRHHAIDAIVIACTTPGVVHTLSSASKFNSRGYLVNQDVRLPWSTFTEDCFDSVSSIIVSYRNSKRLVGKKPNKIKTSDLSKYPEGFIRRTNVTIRGAMHEETIYGAINVDNQKRFVSRWPLEKFTDAKQLDRIVDPKVREVLRSRVQKYGTVKKALQPNEHDPILMYSRSGKRIPIKKVRVINQGEHLAEIRTGAFVETGNNYAIAIYQEPGTKKRTFLTVPFLEAVKKSLRRESVVPPEKDGKPLLFILKQRDIVVRYDNHPDEIDWSDMQQLRSRMFRVRKFDIVGQIFLDYLYAANINDKTDRNRLYFQVRPNTFNYIKVDLDILGNIVGKEGCNEADY